MEARRPRTWRVPEHTAPRGTADVLMRKAETICDRGSRLGDHRPGVTQYSWRHANPEKGLGCRTEPATGCCREQVRGAGPPGGARGALSSALTPSTLERASPGPCPSASPPPGSLPDAPGMVHSPAHSCSLSGPRLEPGSASSRPTCSPPSRHMPGAAPGPRGARECTWPDRPSPSPMATINPGPAER